MAARRTLTPVSGSDGSHGVCWPPTCTWCSHTHSTTKAHKMLSTLFFKTHKTKLIVFTQTCLPIQSRETEAKKPARILTEVCTAFKGSLGSLMGPRKKPKLEHCSGELKKTDCCCHCSLFVCPLRLSGALFFWTPGRRSDPTLCYELPQQGEPCLLSKPIEKMCWAKKNVNQIEN